MIELFSVCSMAFATLAPGLRRPVNPAASSGIAGTGARERVLRSASVASHAATHIIRGMKRTLAAVAFLCSCCAGCFTYKVVDADTGQPLEGVKVTRTWGPLMGTAKGDEQVLDVGVTGKSGRIAPPHRPASQNLVIFQKEGYGEVQAWHDAHTSTNKVMISSGNGDIRYESTVYGVITVRMWKQVATTAPALSPSTAPER